MRKNKFRARDRRNLLQLVQRKEYISTMHFIAWHRKIYPPGFHNHANQRGGHKQSFELVNITWRKTKINICIPHLRKKCRAWQSYKFVSILLKKFYGDRMLQQFP